MGSPALAAVARPRRNVAIHLAAWLGMLLLAVLNGGLRKAVLTPHLGDAVARQLSTLLLLALFSGWFWLLHREWPLSTPREAWLVGALWLVMTLAFETFMGPALGGKAWPQVFEDYDVLAGRIWILPMPLQPRSRDVHRNGGHPRGQPVRCLRRRTAGSRLAAPRTTRGVDGAGAS